MTMTALPAPSPTDATGTVHYRVRRLSVQGEVSAWSFPTEAEAWAHQQDLVRDGAGDALVLVERLALVGDTPHRYEVTTIARDAC